MPRYFFDLNDGHESRDEYGMDIAGPDAARERALRIMSDYMQGPARFGPDGGTIAVDARDGDGNHVATARLVLSVCR